MKKRFQDNFWNQYNFSKFLNIDDNKRYKEVEGIEEDKRDERKEEGGKRAIIYILKIHRKNLISKL